MSVHFHHFIGPFAKDTFVIFQDYGTSYRLTIDHGPEFNIGLISAANATTFKFRSGNVCEILVNALSSNQFQYSFKEIPLTPIVNTIQEQTSTDTTVNLESETCSAIGCTGFTMCNDPAKPIAKCPGGVLGCYAGEEQG